MKNDLIKNNFFNETLPSFFNEGFRWVNNFSKEYEKIFSGKCNFEETDEKYSIELEVPGVKKDEIEINLKSDVLTINWSRKNEKKKEAGKSYYERNEGSFTRSFSVEGANEELINAELKEGLLKIEIPKLEKIKPKKIEIK